MVFPLPSLEIMEIMGTVLLLPCSTGYLNRFAKQKNAGSFAA